MIVLFLQTPQSKQAVRIVSNVGCYCSIRKEQIKKCNLTFIIFFGDPKKRSCRNRWSFEYWHLRRNPVLSRLINSKKNIRKCSMNGLDWSGKNENGSEELGVCGLQRVISYLRPETSISLIERAMQGSVENVMRQLTRKDAESDPMPRPVKRTATPACLRIWGA